MSTPAEQAAVTPSKALAVQDDKPVEAFGNAAGFALAQRIATALSESTLVPEAYRKNVPNCLIAVEMAARINCSPLMVMQNLHVIKGRPSWASVFIIASINSCGRYSPLRFHVQGTGDGLSCVARAVELKTGEILEGPAVSIAMAKAEGWYNRDGSKWKTLPELMLRYRAASFFGRLYAPEMLLGMQASEEVYDAIEGEVVHAPAPPTGVAAAKELLREAAAPEPPVMMPDTPATVAPRAPRKTAAEPEPAPTPAPPDMFPPEEEAGVRG